MLKQWLGYSDVTLWLLRCNIGGVTQGCHRILKGHMTPEMTNKVTGIMGESKVRILERARKSLAV